jgi:hypothetical protein
MMGLFNDVLVWACSGMRIPSDHVAMKASRLATELLVQDRIFVKF